MAKLRYRLPSAAEIREIKRATRKGVRPAVVARKLYGQHGMAQMVHNVLAEAELYDTCLDEIAIERALKGDLDVWERLTHYERREVLLRSLNRINPELRQAWGFANSAEISSAICKLRRYQ